MNEKIKKSISQEEMLKALMDNITDAIYFKDLKSRFINASRSLAGRMDIERPDMILGKTDFDFFTAEHAEKAFKDEKTIIKNGEPLINIEEKETYSGREDKWVLTTKMPLYDDKRHIAGTFGISRDITNLKKAEKRLLHLNSILHAIRNINQIMVREKIPERLIKKVCKNLTENRGYHNAWIILSDTSQKISKYAQSGVGKKFSGLVSYFEKKKEIACFRDAICAQGQVVIKDPGNDCSGCPLASTYSGRAGMAAGLLHQKRFFGILCASTVLEGIQSPEEIELFKEIADDIAFALYNLEIEKKRKNTAEKLKTAKNEAEKSAKRAIAADSAKSQFLANMSHEIRTPMNAILGFSEILKEQLNDPKYNKFADAIITNGRTLLELINDILDLSKIEAGKIDLNYRPVNPASLFSDITKIFSIKIKDKELRFLTDIDKKLPYTLLLDEVRMRQILFNLVGNAVKFTSEGYIELKVKGIFYPDRSKIDLIFSVKDTGIGISEDDKKIIFDAFRQSSGQSVRKYGGTGLGLAITKRLVEMMNGEIMVDSVIGKGSVFKIKMKEVSVAAFDPGSPGSWLLAEDISFYNQKVLVADDIESNRLLLKKILTVYGLRVIEAVNGKEAIIMAKNKNPDIILMDLRMPVMDGYGAIAALKSDCKLNKIPVIVLTASAIKSTKEDIKKIKCDGYIRKPVKREDLVLELKKHLSHEVIKKDNFGPATSQAEISLGKKPVKGLKQYESKMNNLISEPIPGLKSGRRDEFMCILENEVYERFKKLKKEFIINDIEDFALEIQELGKKYEVNTLSVWGGGKLSEQAKCFDMENLSATLDNFENILESIKKYNN